VESVVEVVGGEDEKSETEMREKNREGEKKDKLENAVEQSRS